MAQTQMIRGIGRIYWTRTSLVTPPPALARHHLLLEELPHAVVRCPARRRHRVRITKPPTPHRRQEISTVPVAHHRLPRNHRMFMGQLPFLPLNGATRKSIYVYPSRAAATPARLDHKHTTLK